MIVQNEQINLTTGLHTIQLEMMYTVAHSSSAADCLTILSLIIVDNFGNMFEPNVKTHLESLLYLLMILWYLIQMEKQLL